MLWIGQSFSTPAFLKSRLIFGVAVGIAASLFFTWILFQMERSNASYRASVMEAGVAGADTQLELEEETDDEEKKDSDDNNNNGYVQAGTEDGDTACGHVSHRRNGKAGSSSIEKADALFKAQADAHSRGRSLTRSQQITIVLHVSLLILMNYLLLVFLPGSAVLSFLAMAAIWVLTLSSYLRDELKRRQRWDRLLTMVSLFFVLAGSLTLIHYCRLALRDGSVYQGPARIVGYDASVYENSDAETLRTDLQVTWGGSWGCPDNADKVCTATVAGALCETEYNVEDYATVEEYYDDDGGSRRRRRRRQMKRRFLNNNNGDNNKSDAQGDADADADQDGEAQGDADAAEDGNDGEEFTEAEEEEMAQEEGEVEEEYEEELDEEYEEALDEDVEYVEEEAEVEVEEYEDEVYEEAEDEVIEYEDELDEEYDEEVEEVEEEEEYEEEEEEYEEEEIEEAAVRWSWNRDPHALG